jgi:hypothetical protein
MEDMNAYETRMNQLLAAGRGGRVIMECWDHQYKTTDAAAHVNT